MTSAHQTEFDLSVIIPVYRNRDSLDALTERLLKAVEQQALKTEILFVDDACPENSIERIREISETVEAVRGLRLPVNQGQHRAVLAGLKEARGQWAWIMDADLQDPPEALGALWAARASGASVVFAGRCGRYESRGRLFTSKVFKTTLSLLSGLPKDAGLFVLIERSVIDRILGMHPRTPFVLSMIASAGRPMRSIPIERDERVTGVSAYSGYARLRSAARAFLCLAECRLSRNRVSESDTANPRLTG